jgi:hypothetical protein
MNKNALCLTSLIAAIPGALLAVLMVMAFVNYAGGFSIVVKGLAGIMFLTGGALAAMPAVILLSGPKMAKEPATGDAKKSGFEDARPADEIDESASDDHPRDSNDYAETVAQPGEEAGSDAFDLGDDFELDTDENTETRKPK